MGKKKNKAPATPGIKIIAKNKRARFDYHIEERIEAGIMLLGSEVKSIRAGHISLTEGYAAFVGEEMFLLNAHISVYPWAHQFNHEPRRARKLLLHRKELGRLSDRIVLGGFAVVPTQAYFKNGIVKIELGVGKGKKLYDKREDLKKRSAQRDIERSLRD